MEPNFFVFVIALTLIGTGTGVIHEWIKHRTRLAELRLKQVSEKDTGVRAAIEELRAEVRSLRDTTTQYDLSFDAALQRMEHRMEGLERRVNTLEANGVTDVRIGR
ncbi:MAG TPA: hypothetical protein VFB38_24920 [Chthonomonadaceae bacterium]|nr:hypothetical protein [Chthonomonadaceae bacterium]